MKKLIVTLIIVSASLLTLFAASGVGATSLDLKGSVTGKSFLDVVQTLGSAPGNFTSIPLDEGPILSTEPGNGVNVGDWSVVSNTNSDLILEIEYSPFTTNVGGVDQFINYVVYNGVSATSPVISGGEFIPLVKTGGTYTEANNSGPVFLKRTDNNTYPPSFEYLATIIFRLKTNS